MNPHYFLGACALTLLILVPLGAPISAVAGGIGLAMLVKTAHVVLARRKPKKLLGLTRISKTGARGV
jgi:hypothetical protein